MAVSTADLQLIATITVLSCDEGHFPGCIVLGSVYENLFELRGPFRNRTVDLLLTMSRRTVPAAQVEPPDQVDTLAWR